jgi:hypothetical protein
MGAAKEEWAEKALSCFDDKGLDHLADLTSHLLLGASCNEGSSRLALNQLFGPSP